MSDLDAEHAPERMMGREADLDLGGGHRVWFYTGNVGLIDAHPDGTDPQGGHHMSSILFDGTGVAESDPGRPVWQVHSLDPLHLEPSLLCTCGDHGFIRGGRWVPA